TRAEGHVKQFLMLIDTHLMALHYMWGDFDNLLLVDVPTSTEMAQQLAPMDIRVFEKRQTAHAATMKRSCPTSCKKLVAARPFRVLGIQQVAVGGLNKDALRNLWVDTLGLTYKSSFRSERENVDEDILEAGRGPFAVEMDIMQPIDAAKAPKVHVPQLNHLGLWIDDLATCVDSLTKKGMRFTPGGIRKGAAGYDVVFIHPKGNDAFPLSGEGVLIELVQAPPHVIAAFDAIKE
ncbi:hypothetical protein DYB38_008267, partial [Aphanomyces astaci]